MKTIKKDFLKKHGYAPGDSEILSLYRQGQLNLTDKQENEIITHFNL
jgi:hypothetical protein